MYIGIDAHKAFCKATVMDERGNVVERKRVPTRSEDLTAFFSQYAGSKAVLESSTVWEFVYEVVSGASVDVVLAHPLEVKAIAKAKIKTDKLDSVVLKRAQSSPSTTYNVLRPAPT